MTDTAPPDGELPYDWGTPAFSTYGMKTASLGSRYNDAVRMLYTIDMLKKSSDRFAKTNPDLIEALDLLEDGWLKYLRKVSGALAWSIAGKEGEMRGANGGYDMRAFDMDDDVFSGFGDLTSKDRDAQLNQLFSTAAEGTSLADDPQAIAAIGQIVQTESDPQKRRSAVMDLAKDVIAANGLSGAKAANVTTDAMKVMLAIEKGANGILNRGELLKAGKIDPDSLSLDERNYLINAAAKAGITNNDFWKLHEDGFDLDSMLDYYNYTRRSPRATKNDLLEMLTEGSEFADDPETVKAVAGMADLSDDDALKQMTALAETAVPSVNAATGKEIPPAFLNVLRENYLSKLKGLRGNIIAQNAAKAEESDADETGPFRQWLYNKERINELNKSDANAILKYLSEHPERKISDRAMKGLEYTSKFGDTKDKKDRNAVSIFSDPEIKAVLEEMGGSQAEHGPRLAGVEEDRERRKMDMEARDVIENDPYRSSIDAPKPVNPGSARVPPMERTEEEFWEKMKDPEQRKAFMAQFPRKGDTQLIGDTPFHMETVPYTFGYDIDEKRDKEGGLSKRHLIPNKKDQAILGLQFDPDLPIDQGVNKQIMDHLIKTGQFKLNASEPGYTKYRMPAEPADPDAPTRESVTGDYFDYYDEALADGRLFSDLAAKSGQTGEELDKLTKKLSKMGTGFYGGLPDFLASDIGKKAMMEKYPGVFDPSYPLDYGDNAKALRELIESGQFLNMKGQEDQRLLDFLLTTDNDEEEKDINVEQEEDTPGPRVKGAYANRALSGLYDPTITKDNLSNKFGGIIGPRVRGLIDQYKEIKGQIDTLQALVDDGEVSVGEVEEYIKEFNDQMAGVKSQIVNLTASADSTYTPDDLTSTVNYMDNAGRLRGMSSKLEKTKEYGDAKADLSKKLLGNVPFSFLSREVPAAYSPGYIKAATKDATFDPVRQVYVKADGTEFDPKSGTMSIFDRMTKVYGGRDKFGRPIWTMPKRDDLQGISDKIDQFIERGGDVRSLSSNPVPADTATNDELIEYLSKKGGNESEERTSTDSLYGLMNEIFFNGLDIDNHTATLNDGMFKKEDGTVVYSPEDGAIPVEPDNSHAGDADKFYQAYMARHGTAPEEAVPAVSAIVPAPVAGSDKGAKMEKEKTPVVVPVKKSATGSRCTRIRRRTDADPAPDDVGGLTMKDLTEPTIRDDAEGSSVKHMGDSVIKKSTSELMKERFKRR